MPNTSMPDASMPDAPPETLMSEADRAARRHAGTVLAALAERRPIPPLTGSDPDLDLAAAYRVAAQVRRLREARGERAVGRKIGFTNTTIWDTYGVHAPIWGCVYDTTLTDTTLVEAGGAPLALAPFALAPFLEPRIEPEIVLGLARAPEPGMDAPALAACLAWVAPGFEIVQSLFPGWRFCAPDTVAAFGLHGALVLGARTRVGPGAAGAWAAALRDFPVELIGDGTVADRGGGRAILGGHSLGGGPLSALAHLVAVLAEDPAAPPLAAGEIVSTGTLTAALPVAAGQTWRARFSGLPTALPDLALTFA